MKEALDLKNVKQAYQHLNNEDLHKTYSLFSINNLKLINKWGLQALKVMMRYSFPIKNLVKKNIFNHFCGGETLEECEQVAENLRKYGIEVVFDYATEGLKNNIEFDSACDSIIKSLKKTAEIKLNFGVFKPTSVISEELLEKIANKDILNSKELKEISLGKERIRKICKTAHDLSIAILVDAEESWVQGPIDSFVLELMKIYNKSRPIIYQTTQLYRTDRLNYLKNLHKTAKAEGFYLGLKLVRGAYMKKERLRAQERGYPSPIFPTKKQTDECFDAAVSYCVKNREYISIFIGTHNELSVKKLADQIDQLPEQTRKDPRFVFSQLYGMSDTLSFNLAKANFLAIKYLPYGPIKKTLPYLLRRAEENSSISGQLSREQKLLKKEIDNRKLQS